MRETGRRYGQCKGFFFLSDNGSPDRNGLGCANGCSKKDTIQRISRCISETDWTTDGQFSISHVSPRNVSTHCSFACFTRLPCRLEQGPCRSSGRCEPVEDPSPESKTLFAPQRRRDRHHYDHKTELSPLYLVIHTNIGQYHDMAAVCGTRRLHSRPCG